MGFKKGAYEMAKQCGGELQLAAERLSEGAQLLRVKCQQSHGLVSC